MELNDILNDAAGQDVGRQFELTDPVTGAPTGIKLRIAGPDSSTQRRAELTMADDLADAAVDGRVSADQREKIRMKALASCVLSWTISEEGEPIPFNLKNVLRLLKSAAWVRQQIDTFAADRSAYRG